MAVDLSAWLTTGDSTLTPTASEAQRAALAWRRINDKPETITFRTEAGATLSAQTLRVESDNNTSASMGNTGKAAKRRIVVFGIRNHATLTDSDIKTGYRFVLNNSEYRIESVIVTLGEVQGLAEAVS